MDRTPPVEAARRIVEQRYPGAQCAICAGSFLRGEATSTSDIDLVVISGVDGAPFRESFFAHGWPVEAFVHTPESLQRYFTMDARDATPSLPMMCLEGTVVGDHGHLAADIKQEARAILDRGPEPLTPAEIEDRRYTLTDLLDDFLGCEDRAEGLIIASLLAEHATYLLLRLNRRWVGHGKWTMRALARYDPATATRLSSSLEAYATTNKKAELQSLVEEVLAQAGGRLFDGYYRAGGQSP